jgi:hypothetical protein
MKIFKALGSGCHRSLKVWKGILIFWFISLSLVSLVALPVKGIMKTGFGQSAITGKLLNGLDVEVLSDLGPVYKSLTHSFSAGLLLLLLLWLLINAFLTGGLFNSLKSNDEKFSAGEFFRASARNFIPFMAITLIISAILLLLALILIVLPLGGVASPDNQNESVPWMILIISVSFYVIISQVFVLVADYARAWQVKNEKPACFRALGFGFSRSFRRFLSSFPMMLIIWLVQTLFVVLVFKIIGNSKPATSIGVFGLFLLSQLMFYIRIFLKAWRYGSVTALKELNDPYPGPETTATILS